MAMIENPNEPEILKIIRNLHKNRNATSTIPSDTGGYFPSPEDFDFDTDYSGQSVRPMFSGNKYVDAMRNLEPQDLATSLFKALAPMGAAAGKAALPPGISPILNMLAKNDINALNQGQGIEALLEAIFMNNQMSNEEFNSMQGGKKEGLSSRKYIEGL